MKKSIIKLLILCIFTSGLIIKTNDNPDVNISSTDTIIALTGSSIIAVLLAIWIVAKQYSGSKSWKAIDIMNAYKNKKLAAIKDKKLQDKTREKIDSDLEEVMGKINAGNVNEAVSSAASNLGIGEDELRQSIDKAKRAVEQTLRKSIDKTPEQIADAITNDPKIQKATVNLNPSKSIESSPLSEVTPQPTLEPTNKPLGLKEYSAKLIELGNLGITETHLKQLKPNEYLKNPTNSELYRLNTRGQLEIAKLDPSLEFHKNLAGTEIPVYRPVEASRATVLR